MRLNALLAERLGGSDAVDAWGATVGEALRDLTARHAALAGLVWRGGDTLNPLLVAFLNDRQLLPDELGTELRPGDELVLVTAIEGG